MKSLVLRTIAAVLIAGMAAINHAAPAAADDQFSDAKLAAFVAAATKIGEVIEHWTPIVQGADSEQTRQMMTESARAEMAAVVENMPDITIAEYDAIAAAAREDEALAARIDALFADQLVE